MGLRLNKEVAYRIAEGLASGLKGTDAYLLARPHVSRQSAAALAPIAKRDPLVMEHLERLMVRAETVGILQREEIQRILSLAIVTPKDADSLSQPENAWLLTSDTSAGGVRQLRGISALDALRELSKVSGYHRPQMIQIEHSGTVRTLADSEDYAEMLAAELGMAQAFSGRLSESTQVEVVGQEETEIELDALNTSWMDELE